jgi:hypothetical protein
VVALKVRGQDAPPSLDGGAPADHRVIRAGWTPTISRAGCFRVSWVRPFGESEAEAIAEVVL